jgi:hypothetical protein
MAKGHTIETTLGDLILALTEETCLLVRDEQVAYRTTYSDSSVAQHSLDGLCQFRFETLIIHKRDLIKPRTFQFLDGSTRRTLQ